MSRAPSKLTCRDIDNLLNLEGDDCRPDRDSMASHLSQCEECREKAPELAWFYGHFDLASEPEKPTRKNPLVYAACCAAVFMVAISAVMMTTFNGDSKIAIIQSTSVLPEVSPTRVLPNHFSTVEVKTTNVTPDSAVSTTTAAGMGSLGSGPANRQDEMEWIR